MCGLAAIFAHGRDASPVAGAELSAMAAAMRRRGPDGDGLWTADDGRVGLAHRRLSIIDLSTAAAQPMDLLGDDGTVRHRIVFNGEIYNYRALRAELVAEGRRFRTESDTEVLLHLYDRDGPAMLGRLRGMFAFALWDGAKGGLFLARDPFGIKPLYYADTRDTLRAASTIGALLAGGRLRRDVDPAGQAGFLLFGYVPEPHTMLRDVKALPAGHWLWADAEGVRDPTGYFDLGAELCAVAEAGSAVDLRAALTDSVRAHLVADVPVGVFLSAGRDSATVAGLAAEEHGPGLDSVTLAFDEYRSTAADEAPLAEQVAALYGTRQVTQRVAGADFRADRDDLLAAMDQPTIDGVNVYFVAKATAALGLKVALSGLGGDELFCGYDGFRQIPALVNRLAPLRADGLGRGLRRMTAPWIGAVTSPKYAGLLEYGADWGGAYLLRRGLYMPWELPAVLGAEAAREGLERLKPLARLEATAAAPFEARRKVMALEMAWYMRNQLLRDADWAGMAHSLEIRVPLVDVALFRALAPGLGGDGLTKAAMAATPRPELPAAVLNRPKTGFSVPVRDWLRGDAAAPAAGRGLRGWARFVLDEWQKRLA